MVDLRKISDEELWSRWYSASAMAMACKREYDRRQNAPLLRVVKSKNTKKEFSGK
jgi:hypothetical protein